MRWVLLQVALLLCAATASAVPAPTDLERARQAYEAGLAAYQLGRFDEAAHRFEDSYRLAKLPVVLFNVAQCHRRQFEQEHDVELGRRAVDLYRAFLREAASHADNRPIAEKMIAELERAMAEQGRRRREELIAKATGRDALFLADGLVGEGAFLDAALVLDRLLAGRGNARDVLVGALERRARLAGREGDRAQTVLLCRRALALDPGWLLPDDSDGKTAESCAEARRSLEGQPPTAFAHVPPGEIAPGRGVRVAVVSLTDPLAVIEELALHYRVGDRGAYSVVRAPVAAGAVEIPAALLVGLGGSGHVEYYLAALDRGDNELFLLGSAEHPFAASIAGAAIRPPVATSTAKRKPLVRRWWLWTAVGGGVAVAGGVLIGAGIAIQSSEAIQLPLFIKGH